MKNTQIIRFLAILTFFIFTCPFFQMCSSDNTLKKSIRGYSAIHNSDETTQNAYQLSLFDNIGEINFDFNWVLLPFTLIIVGAISILIFSFRNHFFAVRFLCYLNLGLALIFLACMFFGLLLEELTQIKYGFYLFILNMIALINVSKKINYNSI